MRPNILEALFRSNNAADNGQVIIRMALFCTNNAARIILCSLSAPIFVWNNDSRNITCAPIFWKHYSDRIMQRIMDRSLFRWHYSARIILGSLFRTCRRLAPARACRTATTQRPRALCRTCRRADGSCESASSQSHLRLQGLLRLRPPPPSELLRRLPLVPRLVPRKSFTRQAACT